MLPNFLCAGAQKSATTSVYHILKQHPEIYLPKTKEIHFFDREGRYNQGMEYYRSFYPDNGAKFAGDFTPDYMFYEFIPERIRQSLGEDVKFLFILRNPIDRAYSHYWMCIRRGYERESFEEAIRLEPERTRKGHKERQIFSYVERGMYARQIRQMLQYFPKENMMFLIFEDFIADPDGSVRSILEFLGADPDYPLDCNLKRNTWYLPRFQIINDFFFRWPTSKLFPLSFKIKATRMNKVHAKMPEMAAETRQKLAQVFEEDIKELENLIGKPLDVWRKKR